MAKNDIDKVIKLKNGISDLLSTDVVKKDNLKISKDSVELSKDDYSAKVEAQAEYFKTGQSEILKNLNIDKDNIDKFTNDSINKYIEKIIENYLE